MDKHSWAKILEYLETEEKEDHTSGQSMMQAEQII